MLICMLEGCYTCFDQPIRIPFYYIEITSDTMILRIQAEGTYSKKYVRYLSDRN